MLFRSPGEDKITLSGACVPEAGNSASALLTLRDMGDTGEAFPLIDGTGFVYGNYKIENLDLRKKAFIDNGLPRMTDFAIDLVRDFG